MNPTLKNILAILAGLTLGSIANMGIINISGSIIPPPDGVDLTTIEGLKANMHLLEPKHFILPFLAHALGTFVGAFFSVLIAAKHAMRFAWVIGIAFMFGGLTSILLLPSPIWFSILDLALAYMPMAYLGGKLYHRIKS